MPYRFQLTEHIAASPERVFEVMTDLSQAAGWMKGFVRIEHLTEGPMGVGTQWREVRRMMGREGAEVFQVTAYSPPTGWRLYVDGKLGASKRGYYDFTYTLSPSPTGTQLLLAAEMGDMGAVGTFLAKYLLSGMFKKAIAQDHAALKAYIERQG
ncbi:MAG: SRPBCC family protein [Bacteroidia bacterium]|nr:SRPBCC family protein [Bacteroidia bacterium]